MKTLEAYNLDPIEVQTDFWSCSMQTFITPSFVLEDESLSWGSQSVTKPDFGAVSDGIVREEDLIVDENGQKCLALRLKNSTGNIIDLSDRPSSCS